MAPSVGSPAPAFQARALVGGKERLINLSDYEGQWVVLYFYTHDDTEVCASENIAFRSRIRDFTELNIQLLGASVNSLDSHQRWLTGSLGELPFPWIADHDKELARLFGVLHLDTGLALRGTFIIDPDGILRHVSIHDLPVGRNIDEVLRTASALQTGKLTQCNWRPGEPTL